MEKRVEYKNVKFSSDIIKQAFEKLKSFIPKKNAEETYTSLRTSRGNSSWGYDNESEFFSDYSGDISYANYERSFGKYIFDFGFFQGETYVRIKAPERHQVEAIHLIFSQNEDKFILPEEETTPEPPVIFIGHGRSEQWKKLKDHLQDKLSYQITAYEIGARAGHVVRDILDEMLTKSSFALLVMTGEDKDENGTIHARENVIHELGLFQGRLGFTRAIVLLEEGTSEFSNIQGINQIRFNQGNIREAFGDVIATLVREGIIPSKP